MNIDIEFDVFKGLTALRSSESESYSDVIRKLLNLPADPASAQRPTFGAFLNNAVVEQLTGLGGLRPVAFGIWFGDVHLPEGTILRATYKGKNYSAQIVNGQWIDQDGIVRRSPSDAAGAISGTNVNGWRFWHVQRPGDAVWRRLDELK
jgi:hypothetical protein